MKSFGSLFLFVLFAFTNLFAQDKLFTVEEVVTDSYSTLTPDNLKQIKWIVDTNEYSFVDDSDGNPILVKNRVDSGKIVLITSLDEFNEELTDLNFPKINQFPNITWYDNTNFYFWVKNSLLTYNSEKKVISVHNRVNEDAENMTIAVNNKYVAFTQNNNLFVSLDKTNTKQITFETNENIISGQSVHRNEFGIRGGIFWSPNSNYIAFYRMDQTMVTDYPVIDVTTTPATVSNIKYPMTGQTSHEVRVAVYDLTSGNAIYLKTGDPKDQYLTNICWDPSEKFIYIAHINREQNHMKFIKYDAKTGEQVKILFEEQNEKYIEPQTTAFFLPDNNDKFIWLTRKDGWNHFYLYDTDRNFIQQVTSGEWEVIEFTGFDRKGENIFFISNKDEIPGRHLYSVNIKSGNITKLTDKPGTHNIKPNALSNLFIDEHNSLEIPRTINIIDNKGEIHRTLLQANNPIAQYKTGETTIFNIKGENDIDLYCRLITPPDFDETKKYPVIVYVYGGPHSQGVLNTWPFGRYDFWFLMMAQKGYIIFEIDNRGTANRGLGFEQSTFRRLGSIEVIDQMTGVNYLKTLNYIDSERIGVYGWSYGGFMTVSLMLRTNDTYKVGVAGGTVADWRYYEIMYGERYMDTPETNSAGYDESSLLNYVNNLNGKLLLVHGTSDPTVVWQNSLMFCKKAVSLNKPLDYFPYVGHRHGVRGNDTIHLYEKITEYFIDNL